jgi:hypothetical protein
MTLQDLVIASLWAAGLAGCAIGSAGLVYYGAAFARLTAARRRARAGEADLPTARG